MVSIATFAILFSQEWLIITILTYLTRFRFDL